MAGPSPIAGRDAYYVEPALVEMPKQTAIVQEETFAPILYVMPYDELDEAIAIQNGVPQGLSSSIFTPTSARPSSSSPPPAATAASPTSTSARAGPRSGAPSAARRRPAAAARPGSDSWKAYMRRTTVTVNYSRELPLAQGVRFDVDG